MANLDVSIIGTKGGKPNNKYNIGYVRANIDDGKMDIAVDAFEGQGKSYKRREKALITIYNVNDIVFKGTAKELIEQLKK